MKQYSPSPTDHLLTFGRYPIPGTTKTRLIPALGMVGAAECQRILTEKTVITARLFARERQGVSLLFHHSGGSPRQFQNWIGKGIAFHPQVSGSLGDKMNDAIRASFGQGARKVVVIGTDIPGLTSLHLSAAFKALDRHEMVLGPAKDGGYWLVGMKRSLKIFNNIPWGTETVFSRTMEKARKLAVEPFLLETLRDLDRPEDLARNRNSSHSTHLRPLISVIIPALNEADSIASAITSAEDPHSEIIVVDGGSCDATVSIARKNGAKVITATGGRARQQNRGVRLAMGKILLFLHADTRLPTGYASSVFTALLDKHCVAGAFLFQTNSTHPVMRLIAKGVNLRSRLLKLPYGDQALFFKTRAFRERGGFPSTPIAEDLLMIQQMKKRGKITIVEDFVSTSARRWNRIGIVRTTLINLIILVGILLGYSPKHFVRLYGTRS